jgi:hypothetical protein
VTSEVLVNTTMLAYYTFNLQFTKALFTDVNGDTINYQLTKNATWMSVDSTNLRFYGTPNSNTYVGYYQMTLRAYDNYGGETYYFYYVNVTTNHLPVQHTAFPATFELH